MTLEKKQVSKMFKKLMKEGDGRIFFEQVRQELHDMRDPILKSILQKLLLLLTKIKVLVKSLKILSKVK